MTDRNMSVMCLVLLHVSDVFKYHCSVIYNINTGCANSASANIFASSNNELNLLIAIRFSFCLWIDYHFQIKIQIVLKCQ